MANLYITKLARVMCCVRILMEDDIYKEEKDCKNDI